MAGTIKHRYQSAVPDEGVSSEVGPVEWNDSFVVAGGVDGQHMIRRTSAPDGWELIYGGAPIGFINVTDAANSGTGETDLHAFTLDAGYFNVNKRAVRIKGHIAFAANANVKTVRVRLGAAFSAVLNPTTGSPNGVNMNFEILVIRTGSNAQHVIGFVLVGTTVEQIAHATATETDANALVLKITGQSGTGSNDITAHVTTVEFLN